MKMLNNLFERDSVIKVVSVFFAILIWFLVLDRDNPYDERTLAVPLSNNAEILEANNLQIVGTQLPLSIDVKIKGRRDRIMSVTGNDFEVSIDLSGITESGSRRVAINPPQYLGDQDIVIFAYNPSALNLNIERVVGRQYPVSVAYTGSLPAGYELVNLKFKPSTVILEEKESSMSKVSKVVAQINLNDIKDSREIMMKGIVLDADGQPLKQFEGKVPIIVTFDLAKSVPVTAATKGSPAPGYYLKEVRYSIPKIRVLGTRTLLDGLAKIDADPIDISNKSETFKTPLNFKLPEGLTALKADTDQLIAEVVLEKFATREIEVPSSQIFIYESDTSGNKEYRVADEWIKLTISGRAEFINTITKDDIRLSVNVGGLGKGEHQVSLSVDLPGDATLVGDYNVKVIINEAPEDQSTSAGEGGRQP